MKIKNGRLLGLKNNVSPYRTSGMYSLTNQYNANKRNAWEKQVVKNGLVLWLDSDHPSSYPGSGNTWFDISGSGLNATGSTPIAGRVLKDTQPYTTASTSILNNDSHSIFFLLQINAANGAWSKIFGYEPAGTDRSPGIWRRPSERRLHWRYDPSNTGEELSADAVGIGGAEFQPNRWYYVGVVKNGATATYYVDGVNLGTFSVSNPKTAGDSTIRLYPAYNQNTSRMSSVKIYNRPLSAAEVFQNYTAINKRFDRYIVPQFSAMGGLISRSGAYTVHTFTGSGNFEIATNGISKNIEYLIVAGGGGGEWTGSGGGAGGMLEGSINLAAPGAYPVVIGAGGPGGVFNGAASGQGSNSSFGSIVSLGGGRGVTHGALDGVSGGSGSGSAIKTGGATGSGGAGTAGQGFRGGNGFVQSSWLGVSAGGGGAGGVGFDGGPASGTFGQGGPGKSSSISGVSTFYSGGGGGGDVNVNFGPLGGIGGGGRANGDNAGSPGAVNTGGGGGGGGYTGTYWPGGAGGSGIVIVRYLTE
jgi:hypothetical protein